VAEELGISTNTLHHRIKKAKEAGISIETMSLLQGNAYKELINPKDVDKLRETVTPIPAGYVTAEDAAAILGITYSSFQAYRTRSRKKYSNILPPDLIWKNTKNLYFREKVEIFAKNREEEREALQQKRLEEQLKREKAKKDIESKLRGLLTTAEVAHMIGKARTTVGNYARQGYFPVAMEHGRAKYYRKEDIEAYMVKREEDKQEREAQRLAKAAAYRRKQRQDPAYRMRDTVRTLVYHTIVLREGKTKGGSTFKHLPYTPQDLRDHLESQFDEHMTWDNYGTYWQLDHVIPTAALPYDSLTHPNFAKCWDINNLQPLEKAKNASKGAWHEGKYHWYKKS
jgi:predicted DNA-binding transcriptional regulator AlpA